LTGPSNGLAAGNPGRRPDCSAICSRLSFHERSDRGSGIGRVVHNGTPCDQLWQPSDASRYPPESRRPTNVKEAVKETIAQNQGQILAATNVWSHWVISCSFLLFQYNENILKWLLRHPTVLPRKQHFGKGLVLGGCLAAGESPSSAVRPRENVSFLHMLFNVNSTSHSLTFFR
uniref:Cytospin-A n=1 Tax=Haemonchus placei TaxID=6290 RepID=A0A0N4X9N8_HAEPC